MLFKKEDMIAKYAEEMGVTKVDAGKAIDFVFGMLKEAVLDNDQEVRLPEIGTLKKVVKEAHTAKNPGTGAEVQVPARFKVHLTSKPKDVE